ncbi:tyrosine--tRNA ligase [Candidatus Dojkabacteria bacterium]|nr:tyrosine--tRNA ligase [Candidatus Dojkabacteria bacterium]
MVSTDRKIIDRILNKAVEDILPGKATLEALLLSGKRLKVYQGFDPTGPTLHIGHSVMMRKLEDFRKLGHEVIFLMGNFTGMIGDPSDKAVGRKPLTIGQVNENLKLYKEQASRIIDIDNSENPVKILYNYDWLSKLTFAEIIELSSQFTVQQMLKRSMFQDRLENDRPIGLHEFLYPLMQGYDSVAMDVDVEVGGNDQLFNMLAGRTLMKALKNKEKIVIAGKLLTTNDGKKMGKTEGNMIMLSDTPENIYGKVMAFPDEHIVPGFELLTSMEIEEVETIKTAIESGENPMTHKKNLAFQITKELKGEQEAVKAQQYFEEVFQKKSFNTEIPEFKGVGKNILDVMIEAGITSSKGEARRLIEQNAVKLNGEVVSTIDMKIEETGMLKAGKKVINLV